jgi:putative endonuclease
MRNNTHATLAAGGKKPLENSRMLNWLRKIIGLNPPTSTGEQGEQLAAAWLKRERNFIVLARNWRSPRDRREEIDLICQDGDALVFVEVKARADAALVPGYYAVDHRKKRVLRGAIDAYLRQLRVKPRTFRFDVVEVISPAVDSKIRGNGQNAPVVRSGAEPTVLHFENVALFSKHFRA